jgi:hypothetical protein
MRKNVMNERIRELNLQAMSIVMNGSDPDGDVDKMYIPSEFTKKFAELIVKECADWLKQPVNQTPSCGTVMNITAERLKEHFRS